MRLLLSASPREIPPKNPQLTAPRADGPMRINQPQPRPEHVDDLRSPNGRATRGTDLPKFPTRVEFDNYKASYLRM